MNKTREAILIVDDDVDLCETLALLLTKKGFAPTFVTAPTTLPKLLENNVFDCAIVDLRFPDADGLSVVEHIRALDPAIAIIVLTGFATVEDTVRAFKLGVADFLEKRIGLKEVVASIDRALEKTREARLARFHIRTRIDSFQSIVGLSRAITKVIEEARLAALHDEPVLVLGETGCGKDLLASAIHSASNRSKGPFLTTVLGARPENLVHSELFGHVKSAFTGASTSSPGLFKTAHQGTVFLDEIGDVSLTTQVALLRAVEKRMFMPVGASVETQSNFRVIAATNRSLDADILEGRFRSDLFYRLAECCITVPPLRERKEDIPLLSSHFATMATGPSDKKVSFSPAALKKLTAYGWPGNIRELASVIRRAVRSSPSGNLTDEHIFLRESSKAIAPDLLELPMKEAEHAFRIRYLTHWLERNDNSIERVASQIGVHAQSIRKWLRDDSTKE